MVDTQEHDHKERFDFTGLAQGSPHVTVINGLNT